LPGRESVLSWWNVEHGAKLGVKLELKPFDTRYDTAQTASLWPGVLASTKPVVGFALGGPDTAALQQRLPTDKVPLILGSASNGFGWRPNQWVMSTRPTFVHEVSGFIEWYQKTKVGGSRPVKLAMFTTEPRLRLPTWARANLEVLYADVILALKGVNLAVALAAARPCWAPTAPARAPRSRPSPAC
jgi:hypothetical protein